MGKSKVPGGNPTSDIVPRLPHELRRLAFRLRYRQHSLNVDITHEALTLASEPSGAEAISIAVDERHVTLHPGEQTSVPLGGRA